MSRRQLVAVHDSTKSCRLRPCGEKAFRRAGRPQHFFNVLNESRFEEFVLPEWFLFQLSNTQPELLRTQNAQPSPPKVQLMLLRDCGQTALRDSAHPNTLPPKGAAYDTVCPNLIFYEQTTKNALETHKTKENI